MLCLHTEMPLLLLRCFCFAVISQSPLRKSIYGLSEEISSDEEEKEDREGAGHFHQPPRERPVSTVGPKPTSILRKRIRSPAKSPLPPQIQPQVTGPAVSLCVCKFCT